MRVLGVFAFVGFAIAGGTAMDHQVTGADLWRIFMAAGAGYLLGFGSELLIRYSKPRARMEGK